VYLRIRLLLLSCIAVLFAACAAPSASSQDAASAKQFVASLYRLYTKNGSGVPFTGSKARQYYHSSLIALFNADQKAVGPGDIPAVDGDPVCSCQDWDGIWDLKVDTQLVAQDRAVAKVSFELSAPHNGVSKDVRHLTMTLVPDEGQWRIWNVVDESDPKSPFDVRKALTDEIRSLNRQPKH